MHVFSNGILYTKRNNICDHNVNKRAHRSSDKKNYLPGDILFFFCNNRLKHERIRDKRKENVSTQTGIKLQKYRQETDPEVCGPAEQTFIYEQENARLSKSVNT